jgi:biopolymer transport protein ExbD
MHHIGSGNQQQREQRQLQLHPMAAAEVLLLAILIATALQLTASLTFLTPRAELDSDSFDDQQKIACATAAA